MNGFTPAIDPATRDLGLDDGELANAPSEAMGLVVWVLGTEQGSCLADPTIGVPWKRFRTNTPGAPAALREAILAALRWIEEAGLLSGLAVTVSTTATNRLRYVVSFTAEGRTQSVPGEVS